MRLADGNPMTKTLKLTLIFEAVVFILAIPGMIQVSNTSVTLAFVLGGALLLVVLLAVGEAEVDHRLLQGTSHESSFTTSSGPGGRRRSSSVRVRPHGPVASRRDARGQR